ncbi:hypothetical protein ACWGHM_42420 [Streptomyces sp. NPDC054904]
MPMKPQPQGCRDNVRVAVSSCAPHAALGTRSIRLGRLYVSARYRLIATENFDHDPSVPVEEGPGWAAVTQALAREGIRGVVVAEAGVGADSSQELHRIDAVVRAVGGFFAEATAAHLVQRGQVGRRGGAE